MIALLGFIAVIMSSADSYLNAAAGSLVKDVIMPAIGKPLSSSLSLKLAKCTTVVLGLLGIFFDVVVKDI